MSARQQVDHHLARARAAAAAKLPGQSWLLRPALEGLLRVMRRLHEARGLHIELLACDETRLLRSTRISRRFRIGYSRLAQRLKRLRRREIIESMPVAIAKRSGLGLFFNIGNGRID